MSDDLWHDVDHYLVDRFSLSDSALVDALTSSDTAGLPKISVAPTQGKLLQLLAKSHGARRILEIGTLGGYSTIWLARALPAEGKLISLELEQAHADVARSNVERADLENLVEIRVGPATSSLRQLIQEDSEPFDFIFIDADKSGYPEYFEFSLELSRVGTVIVADNVVRAGAIIDSATADEGVAGVRAFLEMAALEARVEATVIQTVGSKGYDGFALLLVNQ